MSAELLLSTTVIQHPCDLQTCKWALTGLGTLISLLNGSGPAYSLGRPEPAQPNHWDILALHSVAHRGFR